MEWYLPVIWAALIGTAVALYVILDGFDLGIGILFPFAADDRERDQMISSIAPFWDGNETWLVLGGGGLWVAFPRAYAVIMPALYLPIIVMLLALIFRGVSFEFRGAANDPLQRTAEIDLGLKLHEFHRNRFGLRRGAMCQPERDRSHDREAQAEDDCHHAAADPLVEGHAQHGKLSFVARTLRRR